MKQGHYYDDPDAWLWELWRTNRATGKDKFLRFYSHYSSLYRAARWNESGDEFRWHDRPYAYWHKYRPVREHLAEMEERERLLKQAQEEIKRGQRVLDLHWEAFMKFARGIDKPGDYEFLISDRFGKSEIKALQLEYHLENGNRTLKSVQKEGNLYLLNVHIIYTKEWPLAKFNRDCLPLEDGSRDTLTAYVRTDQFYFKANELAHKSIECYFNGLFPFCKQ